jgi:glutathionylspermidine synthase
VVGSWVVDGRAAGCGIRESDSPVTDYFARFVPHHIDGPAPSPAQRADWLGE